MNQKPSCVGSNDKLLHHCFFYDSADCRENVFLSLAKHTLQSMSLIITKLAPTQRTELTVSHHCPFTKNCSKKMMQEKQKDVQLQAMWFAAGTAAVMACLQRAILVSFLEQWRMLVFLALNLLLLAILFTSTHNPITSISSKEGAQEISNNSSISANLEADVERKKGRKQSEESSISADLDDRREDGNTIECSKILNCSSGETEKVVHVVENEENVKNNNEAQELSKEELNRRAEAFIAMFRQHLLYDAKVGKSCRLRPYSYNNIGVETVSKRRAARRGRHLC